MSGAVEYFKENEPRGEFVLVIEGAPEKSTEEVTEDDIRTAFAEAVESGMTKSAAKELGSRSVTVNAVAPGFIETDMTAALAEDVRKAYVSAIPLGRLGSAQDVADAVAFLASDKASYITGQVIAVNGGLYC